jgi:hypothetical protein
MPPTNHRRRRATLVAAALAGALAALAPAAAHAAPTQELKAGAVLLDQPKGRPWALALKLGAVLGTDDGSFGSPVKNIQFKFPHATVNGRPFATCDAKRLQALKRASACPAGSQIGKGTAKVDATLTGLIDAELWIFNGKGTDRSRKVVLFAKAKQVEVNLVLQGTLKRTSGRYGWQLDLPVPEIPTVTGAPPAAIRNFDVTVQARKKVRGQKVSFIEAPTVCPSAGLPFLATFVYMDGSRGSSAKTISCTLNAI